MQIYSKTSFQAVFQIKFCLIAADMLTLDLNADKMKSLVYSIIAAVSALFAAMHPALSETAGGHGIRPEFVYDVDFDFRFDNREYGSGEFSPSMTIFGARLTPYAGIRIRTSPDDSHRVMIGVDIMKDFGSGAAPGDLFREILLYYRWDRSFARTDMSLVAGIFPRSEMEGSWSTAFFSDSLKFYDNSLEGLILKFRRPSAYYEIGCDWMGLYGDESRERFMLFSSGEARVAGRKLILGYAASMYHYAGSRAVWGVVDNMLLNPYVGADFAGMTGMQKLELRLGWLQSMQNDRRQVGHYVFAQGGELVAAARNWNVGMENRLFYGTDMMPYYDSLDAGGRKYGNSLYFGDPFWQVTADGTGQGFYDRLEVYYEPRIASFLRLKVAAVMHFNGGFSGWQQIVSLKFDLQSIIGKSSGSGKY